MALTFNSSIGVFTNWHTFDGSWNFEYTQQYNTDGSPVTDKSKYPAGTIFFDSDVSSFFLSSSVKNVYIDKVPVVITSSNIQYTSINSTIKTEDEQGKPVTITGVHRCTIVFESKTPIDPGNLSITLGTGTGATILYDVNRKRGTIESNSTIKDISISRNSDIYTLTFYVSVDGNTLTDAVLTEKQIYVTVWNIAANTVTFNTKFAWKTIINENDIGDVTPLIITFTDPVPENRIVYPPNEGSIKVIVQNPNSELFDITPTVILEDDSIGVIDDYRYDSTTGTATFYVRPINESGYVVVSAWLSVDNSEIDGALKAKTFATAMDGEWIGATEGRLIRFKQNVPKYLKNDNYASFVQATEDFFNTVYTSMTNGKHISILEKFARINNFDDIKAMEAPLIDLYRKQYGINVQPNNDDLNFYLRNKQLPVEENEETETTPTRGLRAAPEPQDTDTEVLKNYVFRDITGLELNSFIKDIYKNIPYYNQMAGTYRGIKFILNQIGLCVKLAEIWSTREITDNFKHEENFAREDELNAERYIGNSSKLSDIGRYYLTSRFDVDVMDTGLTFREFNELSYNIVKLVLKVKPIHRVLRKLAYVLVANTDIHFQDFILDRLGSSQEVRNYKYTWNLFDDFAVKKTTDDNGVNHTWNIPDPENVYAYVSKIRTESLFFPFNTVDAQVKYTWDRYNAYGEDFGVGISGGSEPTNKYADEFLNKHVYMETPSKKPRFSIYGRTEPNEWQDNGYARASKNSYNNLFNIEEKLKRSFCNKIGVNFCYLEVQWNPNPPSLCCSINGNYVALISDICVNTINPVDLTIQYQGVTYKLIDILFGRVTCPAVTGQITSDIWTKKIFDLGTYASVKSDTNGFYLNLMGAAQSVLDEIKVGPYYNNSFEDEHSVIHKPIALFAQIADFRIALGTDYLIYEEPEEVENPPVPDEPLEDIESTYTDRKYLVIKGDKTYVPPMFELAWFAACNDTNYYLLKKNGDRNNKNDWIEVFRKSNFTFTAHNGETEYPNTIATYICRKGDTLYDDSAEEDWNLLILDDDHWPLVENLGDIELDEQGRPIVIVEENYGDIVWYSDEDLGENDSGLHFMVVEKSRKDNITTIIFRISDNSSPDFSLSQADGEFAISYRQ